MHSLVRRYIKTAVVFLMVGLIIGLRMVVERDLLMRAPGPYETSAHTHAILVGFVMMMILGVALWLFPRALRDERGYDPRVAAIAYWFLTIGTAVRIVGELAESAFTLDWMGWIVVAASVAQVLGIGLFFLTMWSRIRPAGSHIREAKGERF
jgi:heme/copper-type cytochrome/quinol oxidase subunit 1